MKPLSILSIALSVLLLSACTSGHNRQVYGEINAGYEASHTRHND